MKLLFVCPYLPGPPLFGGARRIRGLMTELALQHEMSLLALVDSSDQSLQVRSAREYCARVEIVPDHWHQVRGKTKRVLQLASVLSPWSWEHWLYTRPKLQRALDDMLRATDFDAVICEFAFMAGLRFRVAGRPSPRLVLDEHNVEYDLLRRTARLSTSARRVFQEVNWRKLRREENAAWRRSDACALTSERDAEIVRASVPSTLTEVVPNGVDVQTFAPRGEAEVVPQRLLFFGAINYYPNHDGALYFAEHVFPHVLAHNPRARWRIVGPVEPQGPVMDLRADDRIEVLGFVDDVTAEIARAAVVVVPLRIGGGTRLKILEAMAMGKAIVSTTLGAEGIDIRHEHDILIADDPADFAHQVNRVLNDEALRTRLGRAARDTAVQRYSWQASARAMERLLDRLQTSSRA